jgi:hypothetical protein
MRRAVQMLAICFTSILAFPTNPIPNLKVELLDPVVAKGLPSEEVFKALDRLFDIN